MPTVLVVDDDATVRKAVTAVLADTGHRIIEASDGAEALELVRSEHPHLVVTDLVMPTMDGYELTRQIRADPAIARTAVIWVTSVYDETEFRALMDACEITHLITKPVLRESLLGTVNQLLEITPPPEPSRLRETFERNYQLLLSSKLAEKVQELEASKRRLQAIFDNVQEAIMLADDDARYMDVNPAASTLLGYGRAELLQMRIWDVIPSQDRGPLQQAWWRFLATGKLTGRCAVLRKDGTTREVEFRATANILPGLHLSAILDVTERGKEDQKLHEAKDRLWLDLDTQHMGTWDWDILTGRVTWSPNLELIHGLAPGDFGGTFEEFLKHIHAEDRELVAQKIARTVEQQTEHHIEYRTVFPDGTIHWVEGRGRVILGVKGKPVRMVGVCMDTTDQVRIQQELQESERRFRQLAENIRESFWIADADSTKVLYVSPAFEEIWGRPVQTVYENAGSWIDAVHPQDLDRVRTALIQQRQGQCTRVEYRIIRPNGSIRWICDRGFPIRNEEGHVYRRVGVAEDITEQRQAGEQLQEREERFRSLVESANEAVILADEQLNVLFWNRAAQAIFGYDDAEALGKPVTFLIPGRYRDAHLRGWNRFIETGESRLLGKVVELSGLRKDGVEIPISVSLFTWKAGDKNFFGTVIGDISERKRAEARMMSAQEEERRRLSLELHDQIGQAMTGLIMNLEAVSFEPAASPFRLQLEEGLALARQILQQVRSLSLELRPALLDQFGLADALEWYLDRLAQKAGFTFQLCKPTGELSLSPEVRTACFRVAQEALTNVARHAKAKHVQVELRQDASEMEIKIRDDGIGFDVAAARAGALAGKSLGLLGMAERVSLLGGHFKAVSAPGSGTRITASFPLSATPPQDGKEGGGDSLCKQSVL